MDLSGGIDRGRDDLDDRLDRGGRFRRFVFVFVFVSAGGGQGLRGLAAIAVQREGLEPEPPAVFVGFLHVVDGGLGRQVDGLGDGARKERLDRGHHLDVGAWGQKALARAAAAVRAVEHR